MPRLLMVGDEYINLERVYAITPKPGYVAMTYRQGKDQDGEVRIQVPLGEEKETAKRIAKAVDPNFLIIASGKADG